MVLINVLINVLFLDRNSSHLTPAKINGKVCAKLATIQKYGFPGVIKRKRKIKKIKILHDEKKIYEKRKRKTNS